MAIQVSIRKQEAHYFAGGGSWRTAIPAELRKRDGRGLSSSTSGKLAYTRLEDDTG
jgi:hypothetical protein